MLPYMTVNSTLSSNSTLPSNTPPNSVSWQSAFWPLVACALAVMLQNTGRVCGAHYRDSYALRSSPFVCIVDTFFMLITFLALLIVGCSFKVAAMHVWYDRFEPENSVFGNTLEILEPFCYPIESKISTAGLSVSADNFGGRAPDNRLHMWPPITEVDEVGRYSSHDTPDIPLQVLIDPSGPLTTSTMGPEEDAGLDLGELPFSTLTGDGAISELVNGASGNHDLEMGIEIDGVLEHDPLLSPAQRPRTHLGSGIDRAWRLNMAGFMLGVVPQAVKIFGMRGIPLTQTLVAFYLISFLVPELFRAVAGPAGVVDLYPMPIILRTKSWIQLFQMMSLIIASIITLALTHSYIFIYLSFSHSDGSVEAWHKWAVVLAFSAFSAIPVNALFTVVVYHLLNLVSECSWRIIRLTDSFGGRVHNSQARLAKLRTVLCALIGENSLVSKEEILLYLACFPACFITLCFGFSCLIQRWDSMMSSLWISILMAFSTLFVWPVLLLLVYDSFAITFIGSLSKYPRKIFGLEGTMYEFTAGSYVLFNFTFGFIGYAFHEDFAKSTFKPAWAEYLG